jgi:hypothetical protein
MPTSRRSVGSLSRVSGTLRRAVGILSVSALQRSKLGNARPGAIVPLSDLQIPCTTVSVSILDDPKHRQERAEAYRENVSASAAVTALDRRWGGGGDLPCSFVDTDA